MKKYDLGALWDEQTKYEFQTSDVEATLATMVDDAYVNHGPVIKGAKGKSALRVFYGTDFIPCMPPDFKMTDVSPTIGETSLVDEVVISFTHTIEMPRILRT
jgi:carboxymethylenebutenolidase